jgi:hypothetical protein
LSRQSSPESGNKSVKFGTPQALRAFGSAAAAGDQGKI